MKPHYHKVPIGLAQSFGIRHDREPNFGTLWHYHPELELHFIIRGRGIQYIGDTVSGFSDGDLILLGENLPHSWRCSQEYFQDKPDVQAEAIVLHFSPTCLGKNFLLLPEAQQIPLLFEKAKKGLKVNGKTKEKVAELLRALLQASQLDRLILLLQILNILAESRDVETISPGYSFGHLHNVSEMARLEKIYSYVMENYPKTISLEEMASLSHLSITSFCRYFKKMTNKSFFGFLIEVRISNVCKRILEDRLPLETISSECGFQNVSNFYRHFKNVTGMTPFAYKKSIALGLKPSPKSQFPKARTNKKTPETYIPGASPFQQQSQAQ
ncbi:AraC family transcriptional regulator [Algoriphagus sp. H41]|uniref:AraC family transcriptional regulator n=1 Tax=Algoriphagus oliviformis TaxID=2811231 RepID=A0ABS3C5P3_9BACT|nr:AraC family transcriptional regulator [Algoriphagus oliviformis]MBN7812437.1 AraC family transcriptional regulator [Algoriphagus oliviformis]